MQNTAEPGICPKWASFSATGKTWGVSEEEIKLSTSWNITLREKVMTVNHEKGKYTAHTQRHPEPKTDLLNCLCF